MAFDPMAESSNSECQRKKKSVIRPVTRDVIFFAEKCGSVPQKSLKMWLVEEGRKYSAFCRPCLAICVSSQMVKLPNTVEESSESDMEEFPSFSLVSEYQV